MACAELTQANEREQATPPKAHGCEECLKAGTEWVHLRLCLTCGHVGCCDDSPHHHATAHFHRAKHPVIRSFEPGEDWAWCFVHSEMVEGLKSFPEEIARKHYVAPG